MKKAIRLACKGVEYVDYLNLKEFQGNLKDLSKESYAKLRNEILERGFSFAPHVWKNKGVYYLLDGHQRVRTVRAMVEKEGYGCPELPVVPVEAKDLKEAKMKLLAATSQYGAMTGEGLYEFMEDAGLKFDEVNEHFSFAEIDFDHFNEEFFTEPKLDEDNSKDDEVPTISKVKRTKPGEVWCLGPHRLMCGDSTSPKDVFKLLGNEKIELCFTSPPYADQLEYNGGKDLSVEKLSEFISHTNKQVQFYAINLGYSRKDGELNTYWDVYIDEAKEAGLKLISWNVWDKGECGSIGNQTAMFGIRHEWVFVLGRKPKALNRTIPNKWAGDIAVSSVREKDGSLSEKAPNEVGKFKQLETVFAHSPVKARNTGIDHPAMFPVGLPLAYIEAMTGTKDKVYEPFGGAGTTLIAAQKLGRTCFVMELDQHYCDVILERWAQFTGEDPTRQADGKAWSVIKEQRTVETVRKPSKKGSERRVNGG